ncbi:hypothetical protein R1sor_000813 [Riccia sorocarpa]|uniref:SAM-dependent MTase RsmB/NOP-type domain-containing protein n=1 Tax=Riccia sorocarpa TaxID=122646 RepID=A0ABD3GVV9_9MARC
MNKVKLKTAEKYAVEGRAKGLRPPLQRKIRRQTADILKKVLTGDANRQSQASIKTLIYAPSIVAKKATMALTCRCLKYLPVIKDVVSATDLLAKKNKVPPELVYVLTCEMLFGQELLSSGYAEDILLSRKSALQSALVRLLVKKNVTSIDDLVAGQGIETSVPRYVRINTLKISRSEAIKSLKQLTDSVKEDDLISDLLILPAGTDLHMHALVQNGSLVLQGKASCMPAPVLDPKPDWEVIDACAAPGNKTVHLAALMNGKGKIYACEVDSKRVVRLRETVKLAGASNVEVHHGDFLKINPNKSPYSKVRGILLDPSCSGSGTRVQRLDHLLPSNTAGTQKDDAEKQRVEQLAQFQERALLHALAFPAVERVVYSTCSIYERENEGVVQAVLPQASARGFKLGTALPSWPHRGLPVFDGAHHLVRTDSERDQMDGFFVALFVREKDEDTEDGVQTTALQDSASEGGSKSSFIELDKPEAVKIVSNAGKLSKLKRRKLKRQRKKEKVVASGAVKKARDA